MNTLKPLVTLLVIGSSLVLAPSPASAADFTSANALEISSVSEESSDVATFRTKLLSTSQVEISLQGAEVVQTTNGIVILRGTGEILENLSTELPSYDFQIMDKTTILMSKNEAAPLLPYISLFNWKCALGTWGAEGAAGVSAIIGIASAPVTFGAGAAAGLAGAAALSGAAMGAAASCF